MTLYNSVYEYIYDLYVNKNLSVYQCSVVSGLNKDAFRCRIKKFGIKKSAETEEESRVTAIRMSHSGLSCSLGKIVYLNGECEDFPTFEEACSGMEITIKEQTDRKIAQEFPYEVINSLYIERNLTQQQCADELGISLDKFKRVLRVHGIKKEAELLAVCKSAIAKGASLTDVSINQEAHMKNDIIERCPKELVYDLYITQNLNCYQCMEALGGICKETFAKLLAYYGISKDRATRYKRRQEAVAQQAQENFEKLCAAVSYDDLYREYIINNLTMGECCEVFSTTMAFMKMLIKHYGIKKDTTHIMQTRVSSYRKTSIAKYGVSSPAKLQWVKDKRVNTCVEKYGVPYSCQLPNCSLIGPGGDTGPNRRFERLLVGLGLVNGKDFQREYAIPGNRYTYDFLVGKTLVEINPTVTHNSTYPFRGYGRDISKTYHAEKTKVALANGYRCIHVFDWDDIYKVANLVAISDKIYARRCVCKEISKSDANTFLDRNHLQGRSRGNIINIGLFYNDNLVSVMTFGKPRYRKDCEYELLRYCSSHIIVGGAKKLFTYFERTYTPSSIVSYCDLSKFDGSVYDTLGFKRKSVEIGKHWYNERTHTHITDNLLRQRGFDQLLGNTYGEYGKGTSNEELMLTHGFVEIYDAGQATYIKENKSMNTQINNRSKHSDFGTVTNLENAEVTVES